MICALLVGVIRHISGNHCLFGAEVAPLITFLKEIQDGTIVMMASFDDVYTK